MKIAVSAAGKSLDAAVDPRFGRCACFVIVDSETLQFEAFDNACAALTGGAGIQAARFVATKGVQAVVTGRCGPNAVLTLSSAGVERYEGQDRMTVREAIEKLEGGHLVASAGTRSALRRTSLGDTARPAPDAFPRAVERPCGSRVVGAGRGRGGGAMGREQGGRGCGRGGRGRGQSS